MTMQLTYYAARGSCDQIRLLLAESGLQYTETNLSGNEFDKIKHKILFGQLPMLEDGSFKITGADAIMRYLSRKLNACGTTEEERQLCDMWDEQCESLLHSLWNADFVTKDLAALKMEKLKLEFVANKLIPDLKTLCQALARNDCPFLVGNKLTYVDIKLFAVLEAIDKELPLVLPSFPLLAAFHKVIGSRANIKKFIESGKRF